MSVFCHIDAFFPVSQFFEKLLVRGGCVCAALGRTPVSSDLVLLVVGDLRLVIPIPVLVNLALQFAHL